MKDYPWYSEVPASESLAQGDVFESFPVPRYRPLLQGDESRDELLNILADSEVIESCRTLLMTQACDLAQKKVDKVTFCALRGVDEFRSAFLERRRVEKGVATTEKEQQAWKNFLDNIRQGRLFHYALLQRRDPPPGGLTMETQIVEFNEIVCLPLNFVEQLVRVSKAPRLRLLPPYREHISQAFARFFMRIGLPQDVSI